MKILYEGVDIYPDISVHRCYLCKGGNTMKSNDFDDINLKPGEELGEEARGEFANGKGDDGHE